MREGSYAEACAHLTSYSWEGAPLEMSGRRTEPSSLRLSDNPISAKQTSHLCR